MGKFITYFTDQNVPVESPWFYGAVGISAAMLLLGLLIPLFIYIVKKRKNKKIARTETILKSLAGVARTIGVLELLVLFLRYQAIFPFTNRVWMAIIAVTGVVWAGWLIKRYKKVLPQFEKQDVLQDTYTKYLPKSKRRAN